REVFAPLGRVDDAFVQINDFEVVLPAFLFTLIDVHEQGDYAVGGRRRHQDRDQVEQPASPAGSPRREGISHQSFPFHLALWAVADCRMAMDAAWRLTASRVMTEDIVDQVVVTVNAVVFKDLQAHGPKADRLRKILQGKALRVPEAVLGL